MSKMNECLSARGLEDKRLYSVITTKNGSFTKQNELLNTIYHNLNPRFLFTSRAKGQLSHVTLTRMRILRSNFQRKLTEFM